MSFVPDIIYCADNEKYGRIALDAGILMGQRLPNKVYFKPVFTDQDWRKPERETYLNLLRDIKPRLATVLDWELQEQLPEVLEWAEEAARWVTESVIIIPKVHGGIYSLPRVIGGKQVRLGYSVPTRYGATEVWIGEFIGWPVHALGGSPKNQMELARYVDVRSCDGNYIHHKIKHGQFFDGKRWIQLKSGGHNEQGKDIPETVLRLSWMNIKKAWENLQ